MGATSLSELFPTKHRRLFCQQRNIRRGQCHGRGVGRPVWGWLDYPSNRSCSAKICWKTCGTKYRLDRSSHLPRVKPDDFEKDHYSKLQGPNIRCCCLCQTCVAGRPDSPDIPNLIISHFPTKTDTQRALHPMMRRGTASLYRSRPRCRLSRPLSLYSVPQFSRHIFAEQERLDG